MAKDRGNNFVGIDIGSQTVRVLIGVDEGDGENGNLQLIGVGASSNSGMRRGMVAEPEEVISAISAAVEVAEREAGMTVSDATVSIGGTHINAQTSTGTAAVGKPDGDITADDMLRAEENALAVQLPSNMEILHTLPRQYKVDGHEGIKDPMGMKGKRLEVESYIISVSGPQLRSIEKVVRQVGIDVVGRILTPIAAAKAVLNKRDKELGVAVIDIGHSATGLSVFEEGNILHANIIGIAGAHITNDLAIGLQINPDVADKVKLKYGHSSADLVRASEVIRLKEFDESLTEETDRKQVVEIIEARLEEIFKKVKEELKAIDRDGKLPAGVVLTGGSVKLEGMVEFAKDYLRLPVRIGVPENVRGFTDKVSDPSFATAVGLMLYSWEESRMRNYGTAGVKDFMKRFKKLVRTILPS